MVKKISFAILFPLIVTIAAIIYGMRNRDITIFPNYGCIVEPYSDDTEISGTSHVNAAIMNGPSIRMGYTLREGFPFPYAGMSVREESYINIDGYDHMEIRIKSDKSESARIVLHSFMKGFSNKTRPTSLVYLMNEIHVNNKMRTYRIPLDAFRIPDWWFTMNKIELYSNKIKPDLSSIYSVNIENGLNTKLHIADTIEIEKISFVKSRHRMKIILPIFYTSYSLLLLLIWSKRGRQFIKHEIHRYYKPLQLQDASREEEEKLILFLSENYSDPEMVVGLAADKTGISAIKIPKIIKKRFNITFPQYLNEIRIHEAKRLLTESDIKIIEIAFAVGFSNVSHFNKQFKSVMNVSPKFYRNKHREHERKHSGLSS